MAGDDLTDTLSVFRATLEECRKLYVSSGQLCAQQYPHLIDKSGDEFVQLMDDLHRALVLKIYVVMCEADSKWSQAERQLGEVLFDHLWHRKLTGEQLRDTAREAAADSERIQWQSVIRPFERIEPLRDRVGALETIVMRLANLIGRADGVLQEAEAAAIRSIREELLLHLRPAQQGTVEKRTDINAKSDKAIATMQQDAATARGASQAVAGPAGIGRGSVVHQAVPDLAQSLKELDELIGLGAIKEEVRTLTNYLKLERRRGEAGLGDMGMSLHMVFTGNPGTGKTTVARIVGKIFAAMGVLKKGHVIETDRSGLVAGYAGQTGPKTNAKIDEALDGVLFIDEAYSLVAEDGQDAYGMEAVQTLLKRAEDDRNRLVVIIAGYTEEMNGLLDTNPGLASRFNRTLLFADYSPVELARIYAWLCEKNHYKLAEGTRPKLMRGLAELYCGRDRRFGNGRTVRNLFEQSIRRMANRIADIRELSSDQLMTLEAGDIEFSGLPAGTKLDPTELQNSRFYVVCPNCSHANKARGAFLGKKVRCPKCEHDFVADWGQPVD
jgi:tellurite resistance protein